MSRYVNYALLSVHSDENKSDILTMHIEVYQQVLCTCLVK
jgi:hypothetical protein